MLPENTGVEQRWDFRYYPVVYCPHHKDGYVMLARKAGSTEPASYRTERGARAYLLRTFGDKVVCSCDKSREDRLAAIASQYPTV